MGLSFLRFDGASADMITTGLGDKLTNCKVCKDKRLRFDTAPQRCFNPYNHEKFCKHHAHSTWNLGGQTTPCIMTNWQRCHAKRSSLVPPKVRFVAMTMFEQARHCSFDLMRTCVNGRVRLRVTRLCGFGAYLPLAGWVWFRQPEPWQPQKIPT